MYLPVRIGMALRVDAIRGPNNSHAQNVDHHASGFRPVAALPEMTADVIGKLRNHATAMDRRQSNLCEDEDGTAADLAAPPHHHFP